MKRFQNFSENTMLKVLKKLIDYKIIQNEKVTTATYVDIREIKYTESKSNNANLTFRQLLDEKKKFENDMALLYIKTFYNKVPSDFINERYKQECIRLQQAIKNSSNSKNVKTTFNQALRNNAIDYQSLKSNHAFKDMFYPELKKLDLSSNLAVQDAFPMRNFIPDARIYINPSMRYFEDLLNYVYTYAVEQELCLRSTHKMRSIASNHLDNLILYTDAKSFPYIISILESYGRNYPKKVAEFGSSLETTAHTRHSWFGSGFEYYWHKNARILTFNDVFQEAFNEYIIPCVLLDDFLAIINNIPANQQHKIFSKITKDEKTCKALLNAFKDKTTLENFYNNYANISEIAMKSYQVEQYIKNNIPLSKRNNIPETKFRSRGEGIEKDDMYFLATEELPIQLNRRTTFVFNRYTFSKILLSPEFREGIAMTYNSDRILKNVSQRMLDFYNHFGECIPYCDPSFPLFSRAMMTEITDSTVLRRRDEDPESVFGLPPLKSRIARKSIQPNRLNLKDLSPMVIEDHLPSALKDQGLEMIANFDHFRELYPELTHEQNLQLQLINTLSYTNGRKLMSSLKTLHIDPRPLKDMKMQDVQRVFISAIGMNEVIKAHEFIKTLDPKQFGAFDMRYAKTLESMQSHRVQSNLNIIYSLPENKRMEYIQGLTKLEYRELMNVTYFKKELERINDNFVRVMSTKK